MGNAENPFRKIAEGQNALEAYQKFLVGKSLREASIPAPAVPPSGFIDKIHKIQSRLPGWIQKNGPTEVKDDVDDLEKAIADKRFDAADQDANAILKIINQ